MKKLASGVPRDLETIIAKASARDPAGRYATASALAEDLRRYVEDRPIRARRVSSAERLARWCRRNKVLASSIGVTAAALVTVALLALAYAQEQHRFATHQSLRVAEQAAATDKIKRLAGDLERRGKALESSLAESNSRLAMLDLERGRAASEKGQVGVGMLWTVESLRMAAMAGDEAGKHVALANLAAWRRHHADLKGVFSHAIAMSSVAFSLDGKTVLTGSFDKVARMWDAATGLPIGQPMEHSAHVESVAYSPDGRTILTGGGDKAAQLWDAATGQPIGPPMRHPFSAEVMGPRVSFSPDGRFILTSDTYTARQWDAPASLPDDLARLAAWVWDALARLHIERGHPALAATALAEAIRLMPDHLGLRLNLGRALVWAGDWCGWRQSNSGLIGRFGGTNDALTARSVAWACVLGPDAITNFEVPVRLAELAIRLDASDTAKSYDLNTLGAALYRAGRFNEATRRLEESIRLRGGTNSPVDCAYLAMAQQRLGNHDEARRWLDRL